MINALAMTALSELVRDLLETTDWQRWQSFMMTHFYPLVAIHLPLAHQLNLQVPSDNLPKLAQGLEPWLIRTGVEPIRVP